MTLPEIPSDATQLRRYISECIENHGLDALYENEECMAKTVREAENSGRKIIIIVGRRGTGKTFTLSILASAYAQRIGNDTAKIVWVNAAEPEDIRNGENQLRAATSPTILVVDDIGEIRDEQHRKLLVNLIKEAIMSHESTVNRTVNMVTHQHVAPVEYVFLGLQTEHFSTGLPLVLEAFDLLADKYFGERCDIRRASLDMESSLEITCERVVIINLDVFWKKIAEGTIKISSNKYCTLYNALADIEAFRELCMIRNWSSTAAAQTPLCKNLQQLANHFSEEHLIITTVVDAFHSLSRYEKSLQLYQKQSSPFEYKKLNFVLAQITGRDVRDLLAKLEASLSTNLDKIEDVLRRTLSTVIEEEGIREPLRSYIAATAALALCKITGCLKLRAKGHRLYWARSFQKFAQYYLYSDDLVYREVRKKGGEYIIVRLSDGGEVAIRVPPPETRKHKRDSENSSPSTFEPIIHIRTTSTPGELNNPIIEKRENGIVEATVPLSLALLIQALAHLPGLVEVDRRRLRELAVVRGIQRYIKEVIEAALRI